MSLIGFGADASTSSAILVFAIYIPRHRRPDMMVAFHGRQHWRLAISTALLRKHCARRGVGLGLFGVLSIIRLRSEIRTPRGFSPSALALGLLGGLGSASWTTMVYWPRSCSASPITRAIPLPAPAPDTSTRPVRKPDQRLLIVQLERLLGARIWTSRCCASTVNDSPWWTSVTSPTLRTRTPSSTMTQPRRSIDRPRLPQSPHHVG